MNRPRPFLVLQLFLRSSRVQKKRAILTVAAIAWGSLSLLLLLSFGEGLQPPDSSLMPLIISTMSIHQNVGIDGDHVPYPL